MNKSAKEFWMRGLGVNKPISIKAKQLDGKKEKPVILQFTTEGVEVRSGFKHPLTSYADMTEFAIETGEEASSRFTATRLLALGVFALAFKKKSKASCFVTINTTVYEVEELAVRLRAQLAAPLAAFQGAQGSS